MNPPICSFARAYARGLWGVARARSERLTLEQVRSDLSHETAAKLARLSGLVKEWRSERFRPTDPVDAAAILSSLERIFLRHARLAGGSFATFVRLARALAVLESMHGGVRRLRGQATPALEDIGQVAGLLTRFQTESQALVETLSGRYGARFGALLEAAAEEVRRESGRTGPGDVAVVAEGLRDGTNVWVPQRDTARWTDVLRNLIRNAVQATVERGGADAPSPGQVTVRVLPLRGQPGAAVEILDEGVGMDPEQVESMWRAGRSTHGSSRGHGLTEGKKAFVEARAALEVRSTRGVRTCVSIELPHRDIWIRSPRLWAVPPVAVPVLLVIAGLVLASSQLLQRSAVRVDVHHGKVVRVLDSRGGVVWQRAMVDYVRENYVGNSLVQDAAIDGKSPPGEYLVLPASRGGAFEVVLATKPTEGPDRLWVLGAGGRARWTRLLRWTPPRMAHTGSLKCMFETLTDWNDDGRVAIALNVRDADYSPTSIQFLTLDGDSLGAYYHPGHLELYGSGDYDGDGRGELLMIGKNNPSRTDRSFLRRDPGDSIYVSCVVMLEPPRVDGQAFPYTNWEHVPQAREEAYLLLPPLHPGIDPAMKDIKIGARGAAGRAGVEIAMVDGRIYELDSRLRPLGCWTGDRTVARTMAPTRPMGPLVYIHDGKREDIDLPIERGK